MRPTATAFLKRIKGEEGFLLNTRLLQVNLDVCFEAMLGLVNRMHRLEALNVCYRHMDPGVMVKIRWLTDHILPILETIHIRPVVGETHTKVVVITLEE